MAQHIDAPAIVSDSFELDFPKGYIAHPYWPELEQLINISKKSKMNWAKTEENRDIALRDYLKKTGMTRQKYDDLEKRSRRQFYRLSDAYLPTQKYDGDPNEIVIPPGQIYGMLAQGASLARSSVRIATRDQVRSLLIIEHPIRTGRTTADGTWERFAVVTTGTGARLSNQRALRSNDYLGPFSGVLQMRYDRAYVDRQRLIEFLEFCGREIGIGAARRLGWGRFIVS